MAQAVVVHSIAEFQPEQWNRCFPGELEDWGYYRATETAGLPDFQFFYLAVVEDDRILAAVPAFRTVYCLDTTIRGPLKRVIEAVRRIFPRFLELHLAGLGSPVAESCHLGFAPEIADEVKPALMKMLVAAFEAEAARNRIRLLAAKDTPQAQTWLWKPVLARYQRMPGLPTATLPIDFADMDGYLARLSKATRKDMRRKMRARDQVRVEFRTAIDDVVGEVEALYAATRARSDLQFEHLTPQWFVNVLRQGGERAGCFLYWVGERLAGFNLFLHDDKVLIDKFVGLDGELGPAHNLYFLSWMNNVEWCLRHGLSVYQSGQAEYGPKRRLGSAFLGNWLWFRHANVVVNFVLATISGLLHLDRHDPELAELLAKLP